MIRNPLLVLGIAAALSVIAARSLQPPVLPAFASHFARVPCTVLGDITADNNSSSYSCKTDAGALLAVSAYGNPPAVGSHLLLRGRLEPFDLPRNPGEPDERILQHERGVSAKLTSARSIRVLPAPPLSVSLAVARLRAWALAQFRARLPEPQATILAGELWGERAALPPQLRTEFQETGTVHILVTAGLHLGVLAGIVLFVLRKLALPRIWTCAMAIAAIWCYAVFSGTHLPSMRAALMLSAGLCAYGTGRAACSWNIFGAALACVAFFDPQAVTSASFALSFSCVGAILLCAGPIHGALQSIGGLPPIAREAVALSVATQLGTWPLIASLFLLFAPYAAIANLAVVPSVGATMILGGLQLLLTPLPQLASIVAAVNASLLGWIVGVVQTIASLPGAAIPAMPPPVWCIVLYDVLLITAIQLWERSARTVALSLFVFGAVIVAMPPRPVDHRLQIVMLDVGQADAIFIRTPSGHVLLIDSGGRLEQGRGTASSAERAGERIVIPFLRRQGIHKIDALILSHPHGDHVGAAAPILRDGFSVGELADSGQQYGGYAYNDAVQMARTDRVPIVYPRAGMVWRTQDGVILTFIGPSLPFIVSKNTINDNSIAFVLQYKHFRMLFTGDAGAAAEQRFLNEGIDLHADVLKVGHHGSAYSSSAEFIEAVHPRYAIISVGRHNMFGHPAPTTLATLRRFGAEIYRTDENAAVTILSNGEMRNGAGISVAGMLHEASGRTR